MLATNDLFNLFMFFPALHGLSDGLRNRIQRQAAPLEAGDGGHVMGSGPSPGLSLVTAGVVRVLLGRGIRRMLLCRVRPGEACALQSAALLHDAPLPPTTQVADGDVRGAWIDVELFRAIYDGSESFRGFMSATVARALSDSARRLNQLLFARIDQRLARLLLEPAGDTVGRTQQELAEEVGTTREVVGRTLKRFEAADLVRVRRRDIRLVNADRLRQISEWDSDT